jgi:heme/copper-type cytochrome/quinol oxidase subunit 1
MPRRVYTYPGNLGWQGYNLIETIGSYLVALGLLMVVANLVRSWFRAVPAGNDPWGGATLEWSTTSPPPPENFATIPAVTGRRPLWDRKHPELRDAT